MTKEELEKLYFRDDPDSEEARYSPEIGEDIDVGASYTFNGNTYNFIWRRSNSNLNLSNHGFTHYLTRLAYADEKRVIEGQRVNNNIVDLQTDEGNTGLLFALPIDVLHGEKIDDCYNKEVEEGFSLNVLLLVKQKGQNDGRIRLITCFPTDNPKFIEWYSHHFYSRPKPRFNNLDIEDSINWTQQSEGVKKLLESEAFKRSGELWNEAREKLIKEMEENLKNGYQVFIQYLKNRINY
jgi:hypothetical protein